MRWSRRRGPAAPAAEPVVPTRVVDDLPGFFDTPPGAPAALTAAPTAVEAPEDQASPPTTGPGRRRRGLLAGGLAVVVVGAVTAVALAVGQDDDARPTGSPDADTERQTPSSAPLTAAAAGDLAAVDLAPGADGFTAALTSAGVVLEPRAVGVTVAYPRLTVSDDGTQSVAHLDLAVWNCLAEVAPADPTAAECRRSLAEHADLGSPDLQVTRTDDGLRLSGTFSTYTRPNGSPPVYTGRSYTVALEAEEATGGLTGTLALGDAAAALVPPGELDG